MKKNSKSPSLTVFIMIIAMLISKLLGMLRGVLLASAYGTTENATAFSAASRIPLSFFDIVFASAILGCFIPVYNSFSGESKEKEQNSFTAIFLNFLLLLTGMIAVVGIIFAEPLMELVAPGLEPATKKLAVMLLRIMFPLIIFAAASYTFVGVLQSKGEYIVPAFISAVSNILTILYFIFLDGTFGIIGLAVTYSVSWLIQLLTLVIPIIRTGYVHSANFDFKNKSFLTALKLTPPIIMGSWLSPVCMLISMRFATYTDTAGAIASFEYSMTLFTVITGITTYGVCNYVFPRLSAQANVMDDDFANTGRIGLSSALLMTVPIASIVFVLAAEGVSVVYLRGSFDTLSAKTVTVILQSLVPGMIGFTLVEFLSRTFYAIKKPKYVVISVIIGILTDLAVLYVLIYVLSYGVSALGTAYSIGILAAGIAMLCLSGTKIKGMIDVSYLINLVKVLLAGVLSGVCMELLKKLVSNDPYTDGFLYNVVFAAAVAIAGIIVYFGALFVLREKTVRGLIKRG